MWLLRRVYWRFSTFGGLISELTQVVLNLYRSHHQYWGLRACVGGHTAMHSIAKHTVKRLTSSREDGMMTETIVSEHRERAFTKTSRGAFV